MIFCTLRAFTKNMHVAQVALMINYTSHVLFKSRIDMQSCYTIFPIFYPIVHENSNNKSTTNYDISWSQKRLVIDINFLNCLFYSIVSLHWTGQFRSVNKTLISTDLKWKDQYAYSVFSFKINFIFFYIQRIGTRTQR